MNSDSLTSRAVVQVGPRKLELHRFPVPEIGDDDAILRLELCGICGGDIEQYTGNLEVMGLTKGPTIPGHEPLGLIERIGERAAQRWNVSVGDRVAVEPLIPCGECEACLADDYTRCTGWGRVYSHGLIGVDTSPTLFGGYSEFMYLHPNSRVHKMSKSLPATVAGLFNPLAAGVRWGCYQSDLKAGDTVVVLGSGQRGLACVVAARAAHAGTIIVSDIARAAGKLELAREFGADATVVVDEEILAERVAEVTGGRMADVVIDVSPAISSVHDALAVIRKGGTIVLAGVKSGAVLPEFDPNILLWNSITLRGVLTVDSPAYREAIQMLERDGGRLARMHTATYGLDRVADAIKHLSGEGDQPPAIHVAIDPWHTGQD